MEQYQVVEDVGSGQFGIVQKVIYRQDRSVWCMKKIPLNSQAEQETAMKEVQILSSLTHQNIVGFKESFIHNNNVCIIEEYCEHGDLAAEIRDRVKHGMHFSEPEVLDIFTQLGAALDYLHSRRILHRDLKTQNIFLARGGMIKLGDLGIAKELSRTEDFTSTVAGTPYYMSPEVCQNQPYTNKSDVWSLGCVLYELCMLRYAFFADNLLSLVYQIAKGEVPKIDTSRYSKALGDVVGSLLTRDSNVRPPVKMVLQQPYLQDHLRYIDSQGIRFRPRRVLAQAQATAAAQGTVGASQGGQGGVGQGGAGGAAASQGGPAMGPPAALILPAPEDEASGALTARERLARKREAEVRRREVELKLAAINNAQERSLVKERYQKEFFNKPGTAAPGVGPDGFDRPPPTPFSPGEGFGGAATPRQGQVSDSSVSPAGRGQHQGYDNNPQGGSPSRGRPGADPYRQPRRRPSVEDSASYGVQQSYQQQQHQNQNPQQMVPTRGFTPPAPPGYQQQPPPTRGFTPPAPQAQQTRGFTPEQPPRGFTPPAPVAAGPSPYPPPRGFTPPPPQMIQQQAQPQQPRGFTPPGPQPMYTQQQQQPTRGFTPPGPQQAATTPQAHQSRGVTPPPSGTRHEDLPAGAAARARLATAGTPHGPAIGFGVPPGYSRGQTPPSGGLGYGQADEHMLHGGPATTLEDERRGRPPSGGRAPSRDGLGRGVGPSGASPRMYPQQAGSGGNNWEQAQPDSRLQTMGRSGMRLMVPTEEEDPAVNFGTIRPSPQSFTEHAHTPGGAPNGRAPSHGGSGAAGPLPPLQSQPSGGSRASTAQGAARGPVLYENQRTNSRNSTSAPTGSRQWAQEWSYWGPTGQPILGETPRGGHESSGFRSPDTPASSAQHAAARAAELSPSRRPVKASSAVPLSAVAAAAALDAAEGAYDGTLPATSSFLRASAAARQLGGPSGDPSGALRPTGGEGRIPSAGASRNAVNAGGARVLVPPAPSGGAHSPSRILLRVDDASGASPGSDSSSGPYRAGSVGGGARASPRMPPGPVPPPMPSPRRQASPGLPPGPIPPPGATRASLVTALSREGLSLQVPSPSAAHSHGAAVVDEEEDMVNFGTIGPGHGAIYAAQAGSARNNNAYSPHVGSGRGGPSPPRGPPPEVPVMRSSAANPLVAAVSPQKPAKAAPARPVRPAQPHLGSNVHVPPLVAPAGRTPGFVPGPPPFAPIANGSRGFQPVRNGRPLDTSEVEEEDMPYYN